MGLSMSLCPVVSVPKPDLPVRGMETPAREVWNGKPGSDRFGAAAVQRLDGPAGGGGHVINTCVRNRRAREQASRGATREGEVHKKSNRARIKKTTTIKFWHVECGA